MPRTLGELSTLLNARLAGDATIEIDSIASITSAELGDLVFVDDPRHLSAAESSHASAILAGEFATTSTKPLLIAAHPRQAFARAAEWLTESALIAPSIHPTAMIHATAQLDPTVTVEEGAIIRSNVHIAANTTIGAGAVIGPNATLGRDGHIYPNVTIYAGVTLGDRVIVQAGAVLGSDGFGYVRDAATGHYEKFPQIGRLVLEDDVEIGANSTIDRGALDETRIRRGTKIDNLVHVGHNVQIGEDVVIAAQTGLSGSSTVENQVIIGGQVGIADHVRIEAGAILGAQSGIPSKKVIRGKGVVFWGTPARPIKQYLRDLATLARLSKSG